MRQKPHHPERRGGERSLFDGRDTAGIPGRNKRSYVMIRTAIISVIALFVFVSAWTVNLVSYHPATDLNPLAPLSIDWN
jgi:hypothetical protein